MVHELFLIVTLILQIQSGQAIGTATGFFYSRAGEMYLVTNRHVLLDESKNLRPEALRITLHTDANDLRKVERIDVPLYRDGRPRWHVHPDYAEHQTDVAVVQLDQAAMRGDVIVRSLSKDSFPPKALAIAPGQSLMVVGYPRGLHDAVHHLPIVRDAAVSSAYGVPFGGAPFFLIDANLHPGTSGSPVLTKPNNVWADVQGQLSTVTDRPIYFLGVYSAALRAIVKTGPEPLGLGTVWYARLIEEILDGFGAP